MPPTVPDAPEPDTTSRTRNLVLIGGFVAIGLYLALSIVLILKGAPLGHDESSYSLRARHLVEGIEPVFYWSAYRAPGLPFVLQIAWISSATEPYLRLITASFGVPLLAATVYIGNRMLGPRAAVAGAIGLALTPVVLGAATQVWPDVPGAALGLVAIALYLYALDRPVASPWMLGVPVLTFLATMVRFGAPVPIAIGLIGITLWRWRVALESKWLVVATAALTVVAGYVVLYVPAVTGWAQFGDPITPAVAIESLVSRNDFPWYTSFVTYLDTGRDIFGGIPAMALGIGMVTGIVFAVRRTDRWQNVWFVLGIGAGTFLAISLVLHGEPRYLVSAFPWLWLLGGYGFANLIRAPDKALSVAIAVVLTIFVGADTLQRSGTQNNFNKDAYGAIKTASVNIDAATEDHECGVISGYVPQVGWYSHCPTRRYERDEVVLDSPYFGSGPRLLLVVQGGKGQPEQELLDEYLDEATGPVDTVGVPTDGSRRYVETWLVIEDG